MFGPRSRTPSRHHGRSSPQKRKPFVSTTKRNSSFGIPPPLPPLHKDIVPQTDLVPQDSCDNHDDDQENPNINDLIDYQSFQHMTVRWINMSTCLWSMIDCPRRNRVSRQSLKNFVTVLYWRLSGSITEEEFHYLHKDWINSGAVTMNNYGVRSLFLLRDILIEQSATEEDLEIFLGTIVFEANKGLINATLSFSSPVNSVSLEICTPRWLSLSEELFFLFDISGFGYLVFDDVFFLSLCLMSRSPWESESVLDDQMTQTNVVAVTLYLMREAGCNSSVDQSRNLSTSHDVDQHCQPFVGIVTLLEFKKLLLRRSVGEASLIALISHLKLCMQRLISMSESKGIDILSVACLHEGSGEVSFRPPKLWSTLIETMFDIVGPPVCATPSILLYTLTDAVWRLPMEFLVEATSVSNFTSSNLFHDNDKESGDILLEKATTFLCSFYSSWENGNLEVDLFAHDRKDSITELFLSVLSEYKTVLALLCAAFADLAIEYHDNNKELTSTSLQVAISSLLPLPHQYESILNSSTSNFNHKVYSSGSKSNIVSNEEALGENYVPNFGDSSKLHEELFHAVWASVFDIRILMPRSTPQPSPSRTINLVDRRRKRRVHRGHFDPPQEEESRVVDTDMKSRDIGSIFPSHDSVFQKEDPLNTDSSLPSSAVELLEQGQSAGNFSTIFHLE